MTITAAGAGRSIGVGLLVTVLSAVPSMGAAHSDVQEPAAGEVVGRYAIQSPGGGAVWAFLEDGEVVILGPGELVAEGAWHPGPLAGLFDADVHVPVSSQRLSILGAVSPDGEQIAMQVLASGAAASDAGVPWPPTSLLVGARVDLLPDESSSPAPAGGAPASSRP